MTELDEFFAEMADLRIAFLNDVPSMLTEIESLIDAANTEMRQVDREQLVRKVHSLAGTSETFGQIGLGQAARKLEDLVETAGPTDLQAIKISFDGLRRQVQVASAKS